MERKLAAIVIGDVAGYSRLMGADEAGTMATWSAYRKDIIAPRIDSFQGRLIKLTGDGFFAEFSSVAGAVECALDIQTELARHNADIPAHRRLQLRIGVNLCEILADEGDIYGDGVNIAARVEKLAEPGGICVTAAVHDQVHKRLDCAFEDIGEHTVKNIAERLHIYRLHPQGTGSRSKFLSRYFSNLPRSRRALGFGIAAFLLLLAAGLGLVWYRSKGPARQTADVSALPSILVLPLTDLSGEGERSYFSDGITEDIIAALTRFPSLRVFGRYTTFAQKGNAPDLQDLMRKHGARYFLEGTIRRSGDDLRLNIQLVDGQSGQPKWAERYDIPFKDVFKIQDDLTQRVVAGLVSRVSQSELEKALRKPPENLEAYELTLRGRQKFYQGGQNSIAEAREFFIRALAVDPRFPPPYVYLAFTNLAFYLNPWSDEHLSRDNLKRIVELTGEAVTLDPNYALARVFRGVGWSFLGQHDLALQEARQAIAINPNDPEVVFRYGQVLMFSGEASAAIQIFERALQLEPFLPPQFRSAVSRAYFSAHRYDKAATAARYCTERIKFLVCHVALVSALGAGGRAEEAREEVATMLRNFPKFNMTAAAGIYATAFRNKGEAERITAELRKAGVPE